ncbi:MAG: hypothetical protein Ta2F_07010 [Termitinemataceae bacterium]|nr:MAG: hypothetical protein Ta2F_07010 [Termitinemataceae bacterium]
MTKLNMDIEIDLEELRTTAALAHLNMQEDELKAAFPAFKQMLWFFSAMQNADKDTAAFDGDIETLSTAGAPVQSEWFRKDCPLTAALNDKNIIENSGESDGKFVVMPNVL